MYTYTRQVSQLGGVKYTDCISAEEYDPSNDCPVSNTKQSDGEAPVMREL